MTRRDLAALMAAVLLSPQLRDPESGVFEMPAKHEYDMAVEIALKLIDSVNAQWRLDQSST